MLLCSHILCYEVLCTLSEVGQLAHLPKQSNDAVSLTKVKYHGARPQTKDSTVLLQRTGESTLIEADVADLYILM